MKRIVYKISKIFQDKSLLELIIIIHISYLN